MKEELFLDALGRTARGIKHGAVILLYLSNLPPLPSDVGEVKKPIRYSTGGIFETLNISKKGGYDALERLRAGGLITMHPQRANVGPRHPRILFQVTPLGKRWAQGLKQLQTFVEEK